MMELMWLNIDIATKAHETAWQNVVLHEEMASRGRIEDLERSSRCCKGLESATRNIVKYANTN